VLSTTWIAIMLTTPIAAPVVVFISVMMRMRAGTTSGITAVAQGILLVLLMAGGAWSSARILTILRGIVLPKPTSSAGSIASEAPKSDVPAKEESPSSEASQRDSATSA
jgi:hypothetical protein